MLLLPLQSHASTRLIRALQLGLYTRVLLPKSMATENASTSADYATVVALLADLQRIDIKWHNQLPAIVKEWQSVDDNRDGTLDRQKAVSALQSLEEDEMQALQQAFGTWQSPPEHKDGEAKPMIGVSDWLSSLEVVE